MITTKGNAIKHLITLEDHNYLYEVKFSLLDHLSPPMDSERRAPNIDL